VLIPEALPGIVLGLTLAVVSLLGFSAMVGAVGGGGLGALVEPAGEAVADGLNRLDQDDQHHHHRQHHLGHG
jgi:ABC-type methionine transport system permease subunit